MRPVSQLVHEVPSMVHTEHPAIVHAARWQYWPFIEAHDACVPLKHDI